MATTAAQTEGFGGGRATGERRAGPQCPAPLPPGPQRPGVAPDVLDERHRSGTSGGSTTDDPAA